MNCYILESSSKFYWKIKISLKDPGAQVVGEGRSLPCLFLKKEKKSPNFGKGALFVSIYTLNSHSKCSFKSILEENRVFPCGVVLLYVIHEKFILVPLFQETFIFPKNSWLRAWSLNISFNSFHCLNTWNSHSTKNEVFH